MAFIKSVGSFVGGTLILSLFFLNAFGGLVGAIWLLFERQWKIVIGPFILSLIVPVIFSVVYMPVIGLGVLAVKSIEKKRLFTGVLCTAIGALFQNIVFVLWIVFVFNYFIMIYHNLNVSLIPILLWGYAIATGPFFYMASKEPPDSNTGASLACFFLMFVYGFYCVSYLLGFSPLIDFIVLVLLVVIATSFQVTLVTVLGIEECKNSHCEETY